MQLFQESATRNRQQGVDFRVIRRFDHGSSAQAKIRHSDFDSLILPPTLLLFVHFAPFVVQSEDLTLSSEGDGDEALLTVLRNAFTGASQVTVENSSHFHASMMGVEQRIDDLVTLFLHGLIARKDPA